MAHFGLLVPPFFGHLRPMSVLGKGLAARGHRVTAISFLDGLEPLTNLGLNAVAFGQGRFPAGEWNRRSALMGAAEGPAVMRHSLRIILDQGRAMVEDLPGLLPAIKLDGLVMDQLCYGAESVAEVCRIPLVVACNALPMHRESRVPLCFRPWRYNPAVWARALNKLDSGCNILWGWRMSAFYFEHRRKLGLPMPRLSDFNQVRPSVAQVAQLPKFLDFSRHRLPSHFHYTGPWLAEESTAPPPFPWDKLDGRPLVYASLGTLQNRVKRLYHTIAEACANLPIQLVIGCGGAGELRHLAGAPLVVNFAPQRQLLQRATLMITHAGLNSTLEALTAGVPLVAIPLAHEQPGIAARLKHAGLAEVVWRDDLTPLRLRDAVQRACEDLELRKRAAAAGQQLRELNGPALAAAIIESACLPGSAARNG